jgi:hypothetical protein
MSECSRVVGTHLRRAAVAYVRQSFGVISGAACAQWLGIICVSFQAVTSCLFIPAQPVLADHTDPGQPVGDSGPCSYTGARRRSRGLAGAWDGWGR